MQNTEDKQYITLTIEPEKENLDNSDFNEDGSLASIRDEPVLVFVWSENCPTSKAVKNILKQAFGHTDKQIAFYELRAEDENNILTRLNLPVKTPTYLAYEHGEFRKDLTKLNDAMHSIVESKNKDC